MLRRFLGTAVAILLLTTGGDLARAGDHGRVQSFSVNGTGFFAPVNLGVDSRRPGAVIGDGTGTSLYTDAEHGGILVPEGSKFRLDGVLQPALDESGLTDRHHGSPQTFGKGHTVRGKTTWRYFTGTNPKRPEAGAIHIMESARGEVHFWYLGTFELTGDETSSSVVGRPLFFIVGGTGDFVRARGLVQVVVQSPVLPLSPEAILAGAPVPAVPFEYDFDGFIVFSNQD